MPPSLLPASKDRPSATPSKLPVERATDRVAPSSDHVEAVLASLRATAMHTLEHPSSRTDLSYLLRHLSAQLERRHVELEADLDARVHELGRYGALLAEHIVRSSAQQLARARELVHVCERGQVAEAAHAVCVGACVLVAEARSLRSDLELLLGPYALRQAG